MSKVFKTLFGGSDSKQQQQSSSQLDPRLFDMFNQNVQRATGVADNLQAREFAGFTPDYYAGKDQVYSTLNGPGQQSIEAAQRGAARGMGYRPLSIASRDVTGMGYDAALGEARGYNATTGSAALANRGDVRDVAGGSFLNANIGEYMNPFLNLVAGNTMNDMDRSRQMVQRQNADQAVASKAFGGSRQGLLEAETNRNYFDRLGNTLGGLYASGFDTASGLAGQDLNRGLQAALSNQGMDFGITGLNTGNQQQMNLANMAALNEAARFGADADNNMTFANMGALNEASRFGADATNTANLANQRSSLAAALANQGAGLTANQQRLAAAGLLGDLGQTGQNMTMQRAEVLANLGLGEQASAQAQMDAIRNLPLEQQAIINAALGLNPAGGSGGVSTSSGSGSSSQQNGIFEKMMFPF
jgi:hypothetical protein